MLKHIKDSIWLQLLALVILVFLVYGKSISYEFVMDDKLIVNNIFIQEGASGISDIFTSGYLEGFNNESFSYRPIPLASFAMEQELHGGKANLSRMFQLLLYAILLVLLLRILLAWFPEQKPIFLFAILLLYLLHPVNTEVVCNLKSRDELLSAIFIASMILGIHKAQSSPSLIWKISPVAFLFLAMLCKESAVMYAFLVPIILFAIYGLKVSETLKTSIAPLAALALYFIIRSAVLTGGSLPQETFVLNNAFVELTALDRVANSAHLFWLYLFKGMLPLKLTWDYSFSTLTGVHLFSALGITSILSVLALLGFCIQAAFKKDFLPILILLAIALPLVPVLNLFVLIGANFAERFLFLPVFFIVLGASLLIQKGIALLKSKPHFTEVALLICGLLFLVKTLNRIPDWKSDEDLIMASLATNPESARVQTSMGSIYRAQAEKMTPSPSQEKVYKKALAHYTEATKILPEAFEAVYNIGVIYQNTGNLEMAKPYYENVLAINPKHVSSLNNLGYYHLQNKNLDQAESFFSQAIALDSNSADPIGNLGVVAFNKGDYQTAITYFEKALTLNPRQPHMTDNLALAKARLGQQ